MRIALKRPSADKEVRTESLLERILGFNRMPVLSEISVVWATIIIQLAGLVSLVATRASEGSCLQYGCQCVFWICLLVLAVTATLAMGSGSGCAIPCGFTFSLMTVGATLDLNRNVLEARF